MKVVLVVDLLGDYNLDELKAYVEVSFKDNNQILCGLFNRELKPLPNKWKAITGGIAYEQALLNLQFEYGWNCCLKRITGEENE